MDPSTQEISRFTDLNLIADWVGIPGTDTDVTSVRGALFTHVGVLATMHPRIVAIIPEAQFDGYIVSWALVGQIPPSPAMKAMGGLLGRIARITCGVQKTLAEEQAIAVATAAAAITAAAAAATATQAPPLAKVRSIKLANVLQQGNEEEAPIVPEADVTRGFKRYFGIFKCQPPEDEEITTEQLSGLSLLLAQGLPPYADSALFGPNGHRLLSKMKMAGMKLMLDSTFQVVEYKGPSSFELWEECYAILRAGLLFLDAVELGPLDQYREKIRKFTTKFGPGFGT